MDIVPDTYFENLKRYWRRRRYQRLDDGKKRLKVTRLGNKPRPFWKIRLVRKLRIKVVSPIKLLARFHNSYVNMMIGMVSDKNVGLFGGSKKVSKGRPVPVVSASTDEIVDGRLVMEIYKRLVSTRELAALLV